MPSSSTAFDEHPYPKPTVFMPSRPEWVLGPPEQSRLAQRRRDSVVGSPPPPYKGHSPHKSRAIDSKDLKTQPSHPVRLHRDLNRTTSQHRSSSYERSRSRSRSTRPRQPSDSSSTSSNRPGYAEKHNLALTPLYAPQYADKASWLMERRIQDARLNAAQHGGYYIAPARPRHPRRHDFHDSDSDYSDSSDSEDDEDKHGKGGEHRDWCLKQEKKKLRNQRMLTTGLAVMGTIGCANNLYWNRKGYMDRRSERTKGRVGGEMTEREAKILRRKHMARDAAALAVVGVVINNARLGWQRVAALENESASAKRAKRREER